MVLNVQTNSGLEPLNEARINEAIQEACKNLEYVDWSEVASRCQVNWYDGITTCELAESTIMAATSLIEQHPNYEFVAARLLSRKINKEVMSNGMTTFPHFLQKGINEKLLNSDLTMFFISDLEQKLDYNRDLLFRYHGVKILYDRYLLRDREGKLLETPQWMWMRVAMGIALGESSNHTDWAIKFYDLISQFDYMPSTPTLFNAGTTHPQMASCYVQHIEDSLDGIFKAYSDQAQMSKWAGGIGTNWSSIRGTGGRIKGTNGASTGLIPWLKIQNDVAVAVNQGGKRRGSHCAYLEPWHVDIEDFLDLRKPIGDDRRRTHDLDTAVWIPDLFMERVEADGDWSLFDPSEVPVLANTWGQEFSDQYKVAEVFEGGRFAKKTMKARDLWRKILTALYETGHPWVTFKDRCNEANPLKQLGMIRSSNLCTEITLNTDVDEIAVCNLGSINLENHITEKKTVDYKKLEETTALAVRMLDNIIDGMFYPVEEAKVTNKKNRPIGLGVMGWQNLLYKMQMPFNSPRLAQEIQRIIKKSAVETSEELAKERGAFETYENSWFEIPRRNSFLLAIAPTATISNIVGTSPSIEPLFSNLFTQSNLSGEFTAINRFLVQDLQKLNLWNEEIINQIKKENGSLQNIKEIPEWVKDKYRTVWEIDQKILIDLAAARQQHICQSQSLNLYVDKITGPELSDLYIYAWKQGLKTTYYLRTKGASNVEKSTIDPNKYGKTHIELDEGNDVSSCGLSREDAAQCDACQ